MGMSATRVLLISLFLVIGLMLPGIIWQPKGSFEVWSVPESDFPHNGTSEEKMSFLVHYAILAPSIYNTQPWRFNVSGDEILILADESRWLKVADSNKREMYNSLGGAIENLVIAADHFGYNSTISYFPESAFSESDSSESDDVVARVSLQPNAIPSKDPRLFPAITPSELNAGLKRNESIREEAMQKAMIDVDIEGLKALNDDQDIMIIFSDDPDTEKEFLNLTESADRELYSNISFKSELGHWLSRGGMGPTGVQAKIDQIKVAFLDSVPGRLREDYEIINSSLYLGFITSQENDAESQVRSGRIYERIRLLAISEGLSLQPMSQALQVQETESGVSGMLVMREGAENGSFVQQIFCLGAFAPDNHLTPRWPAEEVLI